MRAAVAIVAALIMIGGALFQAGPPPLAWDEYWQQVRETRDLVARQRQQIIDRATCPVLVVK